MAAGTAPPVFADDPGSPQVDLLDNAACVIRFLAEVSPAIGSDLGPGLSERGTHGLTLILNGLENTINMALSRA
ncbi:MAG TPA: hypothetical protein ENK27_13550 [Desulfobulbus sp.]|nr:hypothetical protein [Desulfobulbus sp.]